MDDLKGRREGVNVDAHKSPVKSQGGVGLVECPKQFDTATYAGEETLIRLRRLRKSLPP